MKLLAPILIALSVTASAQQKPVPFDFTTDTSASAIALHGPTFFIVDAPDSKELVRINMDTGEVTLTGDPNEAAKAFWAAVKHNVPKCQQK